MKRLGLLLCITISLSGMQREVSNGDTTSSTSDSYELTLAQAFGMNDSANSLLDEFVERGSHDDLDESLMRLSLQSAPQRLRDFVKGFKNERARARYSRVWTLLGVPGTGKTTAAQAVAKELGWKYALIEAALLADQYQNSGSQNVWKVTLPIMNERDPHVIILDEVDALTHQHNQEKAEGKNQAIALQKLIDRVTKARKDLLIFTCNSTKMHQALRSRIAGGLIEFDLPTPQIRRDISTSLNGDALQESDVGFLDDNAKNYFVNQTNGMSIRDMENIFDSAAQNAFKNSGNLVNKITTNNIDSAIQMWGHIAQVVLTLDEEQLTEQERLHRETLEQNARQHRETFDQQARHHQESLAQQANQHRESIANQNRLQQESLVEQRRLQDSNMELQRQIATNQQALQLILASKKNQKDAIAGAIQALQHSGTSLSQAAGALAAQSGIKHIVRARNNAVKDQARAQKKAARAQKKAARAQAKAAKGKK